MDILEVPWLKACHVPTGQKWGKRIADVKMSRIPRVLLGQCLLTDNHELLLVFYRWDEETWNFSFEVTLTFADFRVMKVTVPSSDKLVDGHSLRVPLLSDIVCGERSQQERRVIPRTVFNLSPPIESRPKSVRRSIENAREINDLLQCTSNYFIIGDEECIKEIESADIPGLVEAYHTLIPGSYKADLMRYYLLYKYGGVYLDDKSILRHSLDSAVFDSFMMGKDSKACDFFVSTMIGGVPEVAFLGARRESPIMRKMIDMVIENVRNREYSDDPYSITGNRALGRIFRGPRFGMGRSDVKWQDCLDETVANLKMITSFNDIEVGGDLLWHRSAIPNPAWAKPATYYVNLWENRAVYTDGNPPIPWSITLRPFIGTVVVLAVIIGGFALLAYMTAGAAI